MFGQAPATSPFGSPAPAPFGGFGQPNPAPATGGFGQPTSSFGGTTGTFGQPTSTFGQTPGKVQWLLFPSCIFLVALRSYISNDTNVAIYSPRSLRPACRACIWGAGNREFVWQCR